MTVTVNGKRWELPGTATLADVLARLDTPVTGVAVALDGVVVPRASWRGTALQEGASIEIVTAVQGG